MVWGGSVVRTLEERFGDAVWRMGAVRTDERRLIVVDINDRSLEAIGPWPWPRAVLAQLLDRIAAQGAKLQILDVVLTDPRADDEVFLQAVRKHRPVLAQVFALPTLLKADDDTPKNNAQPQAGQVVGALDWPSCPAPFEPAVGYLANHPKLAELGRPPLGRTGHISPGFSQDGVVRHQPAIVCWQNEAFPALSLGAAMFATGETQIRPQRGGLWGAPWSLEGQKQVLPSLPLDEQGQIRIGWYQHPDSFISIPASEVLAGRVPDELFQGAWVLVGSSAFGLNDSIATPFGPTAAGLLAHAQILTTWLDGRTPYTPRVEHLLQVVCVLFGLGVALLMVWRSARSQTSVGRGISLWLPVWGAVYVLLMGFGHALLLLYAQLWMGWIIPALTVLLTSLALASTEHLRARWERQRLYEHLSSYLPAPVAASLALQAPSGAIRAQLRPVTVLFADIRNFSAYCEARPPEEAAAVLHAFFASATDVVQRHGGVIEAFQGDAVLAVWNGTEQNHAHAHTQTVSSDQHAHQALLAAMELLDASRHLLPDPAPSGLEPLELGIGIETGMATAGSFGPAHRRTHLVMGRTVTIANRLVAMTGDLAHPILVGEGLATQVGAQLGRHAGTPFGGAEGMISPLESLGTFLLDGLRVPHHVYAVPLDALTAYKSPRTPASIPPPIPDGRAED